MQRRARPALLALLALLAACSAPVAPAATPAPGAPPTPSAPAAEAPTPDGPVTITFGVLDHVRPVYEPLVAEFNAANADMQVQIVSLNEVMSGGIPDEPRERRLANAADTFWAWNITPATVEQGLMRDLSPFIAADAGFGADDFYPGAIETDAAGRVALLPTMLQLPLVMYNRELWADRGLPRPTTDWTWTDLRAAAEQLARRDGETVETYGFMLENRATLVSAGGLHSLGQILQQTNPGQVDLASPLFVSVLEEVIALVRDGVVYTPPEYPDGSFFYSSDYMPLIHEGRIGMWLSQHYEPEYSEVEKIAIGLALLPGSSISTPLARREGVAMSAGTQHPDQAWRWLAFLSTRNTLSSGRSIESLPARRSVAEAGSTWESLDDHDRMVIAAAIELTFRQC